MKKAVRSLVILLIIIMLISTLTSCLFLPEKTQQEIENMFASFENSDQYILITGPQIYFGKKVIDISTITYQEQPCNIIVSTATGAYAYAYEPESETSVNILYLDYETLNVTLLESTVFPSKVLGADCYNNELYFRTNDPDFEKQGTFGPSYRHFYFIYNLSTKQIRQIDATTKLKEKIEDSLDHNRSSVYKTDYISTNTENYISITKIETGESKALKMDLLNTCEEGKKILEYGEIYVSLRSQCYEKNGDIYLLYGQHTDRFLGYPTYFFIMKYNFESETLEYYTYIVIEEYSKISLDLYIP